jgi:hypothetical protein
MPKTCFESEKVKMIGGGLAFIIGELVGHHKTRQSFSPLTGPF